MYRNPLEAYQAVDRTTMSGRETESRVLAQAALKLKTTGMLKTETRDWMKP